MVGTANDLGAFEGTTVGVIPNHVPVAIPQSFNMVSGTTIPITLTGTDADGDALTFTIIGGPFHGTLSGSGANRYYTQSGTSNETDIFAFTVSDGKAVSAAGFVYIGYNALGVTAPTVTLTGPVNNLVTTSPASITLSATASDPVGITQVEFWVGTSRVGIATGAPYTFIRKNVAPGVYNIIAKAYNSTNARAFSSPVLVTVK